MNSSFPVEKTEAFLLLKGANLQSLGRFSSFYRGWKTIMKQPEDNSSGLKRLHNNQQTQMETFTLTGGGWDLKGKLSYFHEQASIALWATENRIFTLFNQNRPWKIRFHRLSSASLELHSAWANLGFCHFYVNELLQATPPTSAFILYEARRKKNN